MDDRFARPGLPPAFLPIVAVLAVILSTTVLSSWANVHARDHVAPAPGDGMGIATGGSVPSLHVAGRIEQVRRGGHTSVVVRRAGVNDLVRIDVDGARINVPEGTIYVQGTAADLAAGQRVQLELAPGTRQVGGGHAIGVRVGTPEPSSAVAGG